MRWVVVAASDTVPILMFASLLLREPARTPAAAGSRVRLSAGLRVLFAHPVLRPLTVSATIGAVAGAMQGPLVVLYLVRELRWSPALVGVAITVAGAASVLGAASAPAYSSRLGLGGAYLSGQVLASLGGVLLAMAATPLVFLAQLLSGLGMPLYGVPQRTLRQSLVPEPLLGQTTATWRTLVIGGQTLGALASGFTRRPPLPPPNPDPQHCRHAPRHPARSLLTPPPALVYASCFRI